MRRPILAFALFMSILLHGQVPGYVPTDGLVGWWPFTGNANDESGNGNDGVVEGAMLTEDRFGMPNSAYSFDGATEHIRVANSSSLTFDTAFSISFWLNVPDNSYPNSGPAARVPIGKQADPNTGGIGFETLDNVGTCCGPQVFIQGYGAYEDTSAIILNEWHHLVGTYDGQVLKLMLNGNVLGADSAPGTDLSGIIEDLYFGREGDLGRPYKGVLDDIGFWNRALTDQEIEYLYLSGSVNVTEMDHNSTPSISPNPNNGDQLFINLNTVDEHVTTVSMEILDLSGKRMTSRTIATQGAHLNTVIDLQGEIAAGMYLVNIIAGDLTFIQRLVVKP